MRNIVKIFLICAFAFQLEATENPEKRLSYSELPKFEKTTYPLVDTLSIKSGYSRSFYSRTDDKGGVTNLVDPDENGWGISGRVVFNNGIDALFKPYLDMTAYMFDDRVFYIPSLGLRHEFELQNKALEPYLGIGVGYTIMDRKKSPLKTAEALDEKTHSASLTLETGIDYYLNKNWALDLSVRMDSYNIETVVAGINKISTLEDRYSVNVLAGIVYRFGAIKHQDGDSDNDGVINSQYFCAGTPVGAEVDSRGCAKDSDFDGVIDIYDKCENTPDGAPVDANGCALDSDDDGVIDLYDRCQDTLKGAPVTKCGCVPYKFEIALTYDYNKYKIDDIIERLRFNPVKFLDQYKNYKVRVTGYADAKGSSKNNFIVAKRRANEVKNFLLRKGIDSSRISVYVRGDKESVVDNTTAQNRARNRRIVVEFYRDDVLKNIVIKAKK